MIYVMSDIHGNLPRFRSVMKQIDLQSDDTLYILGDVVDRYPDGIRILRTIMAMPNVKMLLGNHEYMMLRALSEPYDEEDRATPYDLERCFEVWYRNGGRVTHRSFMHQRKVVRAQICAYLNALPLNIDISVNGKNYKLVHGAPDEKYPLYAGEYPNRTHFSVWKRWQNHEPLSDDRTMIFGHTPTRYFQPDQPMRIYYGENRIGIDCGSGYPKNPEFEFHSYGRLACLRLDDGMEFYSEE